MEVVMLHAIAALTIACQAGPAFPSEPLDLKAVTGVRQQVYALNDSRLNVFVFISLDCPIANRYAPEIVRIAKDFAKREVTVFTIYVEQEISVDQIAEHRKKFKLVCPALTDKGFGLVSQLGATVTPEAVVLDSHSRMLYRGRIDDAWAAHGQPRTTNIRADLRIALAEALDGRPVTVRQAPAIGCFIPR